jgi:hypothetical protein
LEHTFGNLLKFKFKTLFANFFSFILKHASQVYDNFLHSNFGKWKKILHIEWGATVTMQKSEEKINER